MRYVFVVSDVHLAPLLRSERLPYRTRAFSPEAELSRTIDRVVELARRCGGPLEIVFNGDVFDFDVAQDDADASLHARSAHARSAPANSRIASRTDAGAALLLQRILADTPALILALRRALAAGATIVFIPGNHDAQLALAGPRASLEAALGVGAGPYGPLVFRSWCYLAADGVVLVEHGHQYDPLCAVAALLPRDGRIEATVGTVSSYYAPLLFPDADPFAADPFVERRSGLRALADAFGTGGGAPLLACARELALASVDRPAAASADELGRDARCDAQIAGMRSHLFVPKATAEAVFTASQGEVSYGQLVDATTLRAMTVALELHHATVAVVGHTHKPGRTELGRGRVLLNAGAWTPRREPDQPVGTFAWIAVNGRHIVDALVQPVQRGQRGRP